MRLVEESWLISRRIASGDYDPYRRVEEAWRSIERWEPRVNAYITLESRDLLEEAVRDLEARIRRGERVGRLAGLIVSVKDNISTRFMPTTAGSRMLDGYVPPFNATVIEKILREDALVIGKTNLDEFAMGSTTELSAFGPTRNPWDLERVPGGSSGGSAASLAYGGADLSLGSDTGGSVRVPASYTATVALKPTYGSVSRYGLIPYGNSLEQISPMARSVRDVALLFEVIAGWDPRDNTTLRDYKPPGALSIEAADPSKTRLCVPREMTMGASDGVLKVFYSLISRLESEGAEVDEARLPSVERALSAYYTIALAEAASNLARYDGVLYPASGDSPEYWEYVAEARGRGFGLEVKKRILMGVYILSEGYRDEYYLAATKIRRAVRDEVRGLARRCIIASPATPITAPRIGERLSDPLLIYAMDSYTVVANLAGVPALVQPAGFLNGLPVGVQWMAGPREEAALFSIGILVEEITGYRGVVAG